MIRRSLLLLLLLGFATAAPAQSGIELTPYFGFRGGGEIDSDTLNTFGNVEIDESESYGVIVGFPLSPWAMVELEGGFQNSSLVEKGGDFQPGFSIGDVDVDYFHVGFVLQSPGPKLQGFGIFSIGATNIDPDLPGLTSETKFSTSLGGGLKINFSQNVGLRLEGRGYLTILDSDQDDFSDYYYSDDLWQGEARVGLIIRF